MKTDPLQLFISRRLSNDSPILTQYPKSNYKWTDVSMIDFSPTPFELPECDWLFFYSKNGVRYIHESKLDISDKKIACLGHGTAAAYRQYYAQEANFIGNGEKYQTSKSLADLIGDQCICFVRGKNSVRSVQKILEGKVHQTEVVVYDNDLLTDIPLEHYEVALITSPMNYRGFLQNGGKAHQLIAIGGTTANKIEEINTALHIDVRLIIAESPTEKALLTCLEKALERKDSSE